MNRDYACSFPGCRVNTSFQTLFKNQTERGSTIALSHIFIIEIEISSHPCALFGSKERIILTTFSLSMSTLCNDVEHLGAVNGQNFRPTKIIRWAKCLSLFELTLTIVLISSHYRCGRVWSLLLRFFWTL